MRICIKYPCVLEPEKSNQDPAGDSTKPWMEVGSGPDPLELLLAMELSSVVNHLYTLVAGSRRKTRLCLEEGLKRQ